ncbi:MAG: PilN domain-containing protein [Candidatus Zambryskibacteria bacterium]|nr:PilN domain-containing protein [Candidatus Zambryskibacteria bacterium]
MFNLLPNNLKEKVRSEYYLHLIIFILLSILVVQVSFLIFLFPSWLISLDKEKEITLQAEKSNISSLDSEIDVINSTIKSINTKLNTINSTLEYPKVTPFVDSILSNKIKDIYINELVYTSLSKTTASITLDGVSATRESLVSFVKKLEETKLFKKVDLPISNFTKNANINFSINTTIAL